VHLPLLPLESLRPRWCEPVALAVTAQGEVMALTAQARAQGVRIGMRKSGVQAVAPTVLVQERDVVLEQAAFDAVALTLLQYSPELAAADAACLLLDVTASLSAFGGRLALCRRVRHSVQAMGLSLRLGMAPTAQAAWLFALQHSAQRSLCLRRAVRMKTMTRLLDRLPFTLLPAAARHADWLSGIGCRTLADVRRLPRAGLKRRSDASLLRQLDCAYGALPELFNWIVAPDNFSAAVTLPYSVEHAQALLFGAQRLLLQMTGWLVARHKAVTRLALLLEHERGRHAIEPTQITISLAEPAWQDTHLLRLLKERLAQLTLTAPVVALRLEAGELSDLMPPSASLFPEPGGTPGDAQRLLELLSARLGPEAIMRPCPHPDHRPERANQWQSVSTKTGTPVPTPAANALTGAARPFWLLEKPLALLLRGHRPFYGSPLQIVSGPERIETGWWDGELVLRDYFVAQGEEGACYWIYRERDAGSARWFLHGLFA